MSQPKKRRIKNIILGLILLMILAVNAIAFMQAWTMTHFVVGGVATASAEKLSLGQKFWVMIAGVRMPRPKNLRTPADFNLPFTIGHVQGKDVNLEVWSIPSDDSPRGLILMYHAYGGDKESLLPIAKQFHQIGYATEIVDFRGSGGSTGNSTTVGYKEADDVVATFNDAKKNLPVNSEPIVLYGQSMGAAAVLRAVGDLGISPNAIIVESPFDRIICRTQNRFRAMNLPSFPLANLLIFWGGVQQGYWGFDLNPGESAKNVHCPALMFHGQLDRRVTTAQANSLFNNLAGPKHLEIYANAGHLAFYSTDPQRWRKNVKDFLDRYAP
jgi:alpha-beta hydrolase superfamily lysophospholipase